MAAVAGGLAIGLLGAVVGAQVFDADDDEGTAEIDERFATGEINSPDDLLPDDVVVPPGAGAQSAEAALTGFLEAEVAGDYETSFGFLSDADRVEHASPEGWLATHADVVPRILGYELQDQVEDGAGRATVTAALTLEPGLDQVTGLTPAEAIVRWDVVEGAGGWGVSLQTSAYEPVLPDEAGAAPAAQAWAEAHQRCDQPDDEHGLLVGSPALARTLCDAAGAVEVGAPDQLATATPSPSPPCSATRWLASLAWCASPVPPSSPRSWCPSATGGRSSASCPETPANQKLTGRQHMATTHPPGGVPRTWALAAAAGLTFASLLGTALPAGAETFIDPNDRCLPDAEAPPAPVSDRGAISAVHVPSVDCVFAQGISVGTTSGTYDPKGMTRRDQMASFIVRSLEASGYEVPAAGDQGFTDIDGNTHEDSINRLAAIDVVLGRSSTSYAPSDLVRRDQMASFIVRAVEWAYDEDGGIGIGGEPTPAFPDVPRANVHSVNVNVGAQVLGLLAGKEDGTFDPRANVTREQMASFLVRVVDMTLIVE